VKLKLLFQLFVLFFSSAGLAQSSRLDDFSIVPNKSGDKVIVYWITAAGSTCPELFVERGNDGVNFEKVYAYPTVSGSTDEEISYSWVDPNPIQFANNYYRINLQDVEFTLPLLFSNQLNLADRKIISYPNPSDGEVTLDFRNPKELQFDLLIFNLAGKMVYKKENLEGRTTKFSLIGLPTDYYTAHIRFEDDSDFTIAILFNE